MKLKKLIALFIAAGIITPGVASATNGYFSHGNGIKAKGMAGVGIALPQDALAAANNPAGMVMVGDRLDMGLDWCRPIRDTVIVSGPLAGTYSGSDTKNFFIPEFGYNQMLNPNMSVGVSVYGNGGMNTGYKDFNARTGGAVFGTGKLGVDLMQLFIAPTFAMKLNPDHAIGVSLNLAYQRFKAEGLQNFDSPASSNPGSVTNNGYDSSTGWGVRLGWTGKVAPNVTLGATYQSKTRMGKFSKYKGLFAEQGDFDIPANYGVGIAVKVNPKTTIAADIERIEYGGVKSLSNSGNAMAQLGTEGGPGFGWRDMTIFKLGATYEVSNALTLRAGYSKGRQPIPSDQTLFNVLAPAVIEDHFTLGATWILANKSELSLGYMHAFKKTVTGTGATTGFNSQMYQDSVGVAYGWKM